MSSDNKTTEPKCLENFFGNLKLRSIFIDKYEQKCQQIEFDIIIFLCYNLANFQNKNSTKNKFSQFKLFFMSFKFPTRKEYLDFLNYQNSLNPFSRISGYTFQCVD